jgi:hypothetical protein
MTMQITKIQISNYAGITALEAAIPEHGVVIEGGNKRGKSSVLHALQSALSGRGVDASVVHLGAEHAEVRVSLTSQGVDHLVRRRVSAMGASTIDVTVGDLAAKKPAAFLASLLGASLDPLELVEATPKRRRALVLAALPIRVTREQIHAWVPDAGDVDVSGHGLDVIERLSGEYYVRRTQQNAAVKIAAAEAARLQSCVLGVTDPRGNEAISIDDAIAAETVARAELSRLTALETAGLAERERIARVSEHIGRLDTDALDFEASASKNDRRDELENARVNDREAESSLARATEAQRQAEAHARQCAAILAQLTQCEHRRIEFQIAAEKSRREADERRAMLAAVAAPSPEPGARTEAERALAATQTQLMRARNAASYARAVRAAEVAAAHHAAEEAKARELDAIVVTLTKAAPRELIAACDGIRGLSVAGDDIALDGVPWTGLSTSEQMIVALEVARRASRSSIFFVDRLESIDAERREEFVRLATLDGGQLFATMVTRGEMQLVAVELANPAESAA